MASSALPPPGADNPGASPGGGFPSPAPAQANQGAVQILELVRNIVSSARMLGQKVPGAVPIVRQINDLAQQLQMKILQSQPGTEPQAPPV
jgi:hypothetical protein